MVFKGNQTILDIEQTTKDLTNYVKYVFPTEFSVKDSKNIHSFDIGLAEWAPIEQMGLERPPVLVTDKLLQMR